MKRPMILALDPSGFAGRWRCSASSRSLRPSSLADHAARDRAGPDAAQFAASTACLGVIALLMSAALLGFLAAVAAVGTCCLSGRFAPECRCAAA